MTKQIKLVVAFVLLGLIGTKALANPTPLFDDKTRVYAIPTLAKNPKGEVVLSWTEKDQQGMVYFYCAISKDKGTTFSDKKLIYSATGIGSSRLMRPKLIFKKDGTMVAVFSNRTDVPATAATPAPATHEGGHGDAHAHEKPAATPSAEAKPKRDLQIMYCSSKDQGATWTAPQPVDIEPIKGIVRGFFDAVVLPNDEIAVAYLKDVKGSTKHEERDLRLAVTKNGVFQPEKLIDAVVCDCCNISLLVDSKGTLNIYYRDNNDDIRDIALMTSTDNAATFSKSQILHNDNWVIKGCPHTGAISSVFGKTNLISWFSSGTNQPGLRLTTQEGKLLSVISDATAKNAYVTSTATHGVLLWEQTKKESEATFSQIAYRKIEANKVSETMLVADSMNGMNASGLVVDNQLIMAYEIKQANNLNSIKISTIGL